MIPIAKAKDFIGKEVLFYKEGLPCKGKLIFVDDEENVVLPFLVLEGKTPLWYMEIEELPKEPEYVPFGNTDELIGCWNNKVGKHYNDRLQMPFVWLRMKGIPKDVGHIITDYVNDRQVVVNGEDCYMDKLFINYVFIDGSPCGKIKE